MENIIDRSEIRRLLEIYNDKKVRLIGRRNNMVVFGLTGQLYKNLDFCSLVVGDGNYYSFDDDMIDRVVLDTEKSLKLSIILTL